MKIFKGQGWIKLKRLFVRTGRYITSVINKLIYYILYILYKIHIVKLYNYRCNEDLGVPFSPEYSACLVHTKFISAKVLNRVHSNVNVHEKWFYFSDKYKPIYKIEDSHDYTTTITSCLKNIVLHLDGHDYPVADGLPSIGMYPMGVMNVDPIRRVRIVYKINIKKIQDMVVSKTIHCHYWNITPPDYAQIYNKAAIEFEVTLSNMDFNEFLIKQESGLR